VHGKSHLRGEVDGSNETLGGSQALAASIQNYGTTFSQIDMYFSLTYGFLHVPKVTVDASSLGCGLAFGPSGTGVIRAEPSSVPVL